MRTTLTIDDDVAALLEQLRKKRGAGLKEIEQTIGHEPVKHIAPRLAQAASGGA